jgi:DNA-binding NarL/FixJ family response regulator
MTPAEARSWAAYLQEGSVKRAAESLGVHEQTVKRHLANIRSRLGVTSNAQAAFVLARQLPT